METITAPTSAGRKSIIRYARSAQGWFGYWDFLCSVASRDGIHRVCDVGGGANPSLPIEFLIEHELEYTLLDISQEELDKAPDGYLKQQADIMVPRPELFGSYDLIFSRMVAEHVTDGRTFHKNIYDLLAPGGTAFHYFPTLFTIPFVINRLIPERLAEKILNLVQAGRERHGKQAKFPAYYSWCRGPLRSQIRKFEELGYIVEEYRGHYGHSYYAKLPPLHWLHEKLSDYLVQHPMPSMTTFVYLILRKPG